MSDVLYILSAMETFTVGQADLLQMVFGPSPSTRNVAVNLLLFRAEIIDNLPGHGLIDFVNVVEMRAILCSMFVASPDSNVRHSFLEVLPWHIAYVNICFLMLLDAKGVIQGGIVIAQLLDKQSNRSGMINVIVAPVIDHVYDIPHHVDSFREFRHDALEGSDPLDEYIHTRVQVT